MKAYPTPHINATPEDFAKTVLMPGDPLRAKFIAENFLEDAVLVNNVRGIQGYTGQLPPGHSPDLAGLSDNRLRGWQF